MTDTTTETAAMTVAIDRYMAATAAYGEALRNAGDDERAHDIVQWARAALYSLAADSGYSRSETAALVNARIWG